MIARNIAAYLFFIPAIVSCTDKSPGGEPSIDGSMESGVFEDFKYPERYAAIVEMAESGDKNSISLLSQYYANFPKTDLRNLEYWSIKSSNIWGRRELTNLIVALARHQNCDRAWEVLSDNYPDLTEFSFYEAGAYEETIDMKCGRKL